jgi:hypothetical protein
VSGKRSHPHDLRFRTADSPTAVYLGVGMPLIIPGIRIVSGGRFPWQVTDVVSQFVIDQNTRESGVVRNTGRTGPLLAQQVGIQEPACVFILQGIISNTFRFAWVCLQHVFDRCFAHRYRSAIRPPPVLQVCIILLFECHQTPGIITFAK